MALTPHLAPQGEGAWDPQDALSSFKNQKKCEYDNNDQAWIVLSLYANIFIKHDFQHAFMKEGTPTGKRAQSL